MPPDQPGGVPDASARSITWLECARAADDGKEILAFLVDDKVSWPEEQREEFRITAAIRADSDTPELLATVKRDVRRLRDFRAWLNDHRIRANFSTPDTFRTGVSDALREWRERHPDFSRQGAGSTPAGDPSKYLQALSDATAYIDLRGLQVGTGKAYRFPIEDLYMSLTTTAVGDDPKVPERAPRGNRSGRRTSKSRPVSKGADDPLVATALDRPAHVALHDVLRHPRLVVIGDPGTGKTTFLRRVTHAVVQALRGVEPATAESIGIVDRPLPVLVRLAELADHIAGSRQGTGPRPSTPDAAAWLPHFLAAVSRDSHWALDETFFRHQLEQGTCLILLDGLDEAPDRPAREALARLIENVSTAYQRCRIVVTTGPPAYTGHAILPGFTHVNVDPLSDDAIQTFLRRWAGELHAESPAQAETHVAELIAAVGEPGIARLARNPVMLTALAVVHWNERRLPEQRADLYESIVKWLSRARDQRSGRPRAEQCVKLLQELALAMQLEWCDSFFHRVKPEGIRVVRGGSWSWEAGETRSALRRGIKPAGRDRILGFWVVAAGLGNGGGPLQLYPST